MSARDLFIFAEGRRVSHVPALRRSGAGGKNRPRRRFVRFGATPPGALPAPDLSRRDAAG
jgi:hypothetical protein